MIQLPKVSPISTPVVKKPEEAGERVVETPREQRIPGDVVFTGRERRKFPERRDPFKRHKQIIDRRQTERRSDGRINVDV